MSVAPAPNEIFRRAVKEGERRLDQSLLELVSTGFIASNICTRCAAWLSRASASKKASNTPVWLSRQKRFQTLFQLPNSAGRARQVMLWTEK